MSFVVCRFYAVAFLYRLSIIVYIDQFRAEAFIKSLSSDKSTTDGVKPSRTTSVTRQISSPSSSSLSPPLQPSSSSTYRRRSSVSVSGPGDSRQRTIVSRSLSSSLPLPTSPTSPPPRHHLPAADAAVETDVKTRVSGNDIPTPATIQALFDVRQPHLYVTGKYSVCFVRFMWVVCHSVWAGKKSRREFVTCTPCPENNYSHTRC